jgi:replicative DNA helicase
MSETEEAVKYDFDEAFQEQILTSLMRDTSFAMKTKDIVEPNYFTNDAVKTVVAICQAHIETYRSAPGARLMPMLIKEAIVSKKVRKEQIEDIKNLLKRTISSPISNIDFVTDKVASFAKHQAMEIAILESVGFLEKGKFDKIGEAFKNALSVGAINDGEDYDFYEEIKSRTQQRQDIKDGKVVKRGITSGYSKIDSLLYHGGWGRKELACMMGPAKSGKSMSLGDFCKNASMANYNVLYVSLEVAKEIVAARIDAAMTNTIMRKLHDNPGAVESTIKGIEARSGLFKIQDRPSGTMKPSHLESLLNKYRSDGIIFDLVAVDYGDIMASEYRSDKLTDNLRSIYIDLRAIAHEQDIAMLTATQTNRDGAKAVTAKATDVGDDFNKVRTVDLLIGINATDAEKAAGEARLYWAASRNTEDGFTVRIKQDREKMKFIDSVVGKE